MLLSSPGLGFEKIGILKQPTMCLLRKRGCGWSKNDDGCATGVGGREDGGVGVGVRHGCAALVQQERGIGRRMGF